MTCDKCGFPINPGSSFCPNCGNRQLNENYVMESFNEENIERMLSNFGLNKDHYLYMMTNLSTLQLVVGGTLANFARQYCIMSFNENEVVLFMLSRLDNKKVTNIIKINKCDIDTIKLKNVIISYNLKIKSKLGSIGFQLFKKVRGMSKQKENIKIFKSMYIS